MEGNSLAPFWLGAVLIFNLVVGIGMNIYNSAALTIDESLTTMTTQEIEAFNIQFELYEGKQTGSQVSSLVARLIASASTFSEEPDRVPTVDFIQDSELASKKISVHAVYNSNSPSDLEVYINNMSIIKNSIENKHTYNISFSYSPDGLINLVTIDY